MTAPARSRRRPFGALAGLAVVIVGGWTGAWFYIRAEIAANIDQTLMLLGQQGVAVACPARGMAGWPFRIDVTCEAPSLTVARSGLRVDVARVAVSGLVYRPNHYIVAVAGPLTVKRGGDSGAATWTDLRFSLAFENERLARFSLATQGFQGTLRPAGEPEQALTLASGEAHLVPAGAVVAASAAAANGVDDYRLALVARHAEARVGGAAATPVPVDVDLDAITTDFPGLILDPRRLAAAGAGLEIARLRVGLGDAALDGGGRLTLATDGGIDGFLEMQPAAESPPGAAAAPASLKAALAGTLLMFGTTSPSQTGRAGKRLDVTVDNGVVRVGRLTLARLRPLF